MNTQTLSALVAAIVSLAIGGAVLLREPRRAVHVLFATFAFNIAIEKLLSFFSTGAAEPDSLLKWAVMAATVSLPATAQRFFQAFLGDEAGPPPLSRTTVVGAGLLYSALLLSRFLATPIHTRFWFHAALVAYVFVGRREVRRAEGCGGGEDEAGEACLLLCVEKVGLAVGLR